MPLSVECMYDGALIGIDEALQIRDTYERSRGARPHFVCVQCGELVRAHREGPNNQAHFEHFERNQSCRLSHEALTTRAAGSLRADFEIEDEEALEGYALDRKWLSHSRNSRIALQCKQRDDFTCQACELRLQVNGRFVIECHHLKPLSIRGEDVVSLSELVSLCPTCHRIAHMRRPPFTIEEVRALLVEKA